MSRHAGLLCCWDGSRPTADKKVDSRFAQKLSQKYASVALIPDLACVSLRFRFLNPAHERNLRAGLCGKVQTSKVAEGRKETFEISSKLPRLS